MANDLCWRSWLKYYFSSILDCNVDFICPFNPVETLPTETKDSNSRVVLHLNHGKQELFSLKQILATVFTQKTQEK